MRNPGYHDLNEGERKAREMARSHSGKLSWEADRRTMSLAAGALAVSIIFKSPLMPADPTHVICLDLSCVAFVVCIVSFLVHWMLDAGAWSTVAFDESPVSDARGMSIAVSRVVGIGAFLIGLILLTSFALADP
ncbi:MAG: hypothetical protein ACYTGF_07665 [Planctomycetota bacterium]|jgi:hypothetical protein